ncbi:hypothetical protein CBW24_08330 [Pacificitalea manganoxidans]|uniref:N-acetyltransferase domain-containing protein n=1 Tax=Pacificitalea manganoxidans TaxID=1411902 RepID=A0A291LZB2_9RHOB|nr:GNAT family N-acetyltransferase [Pacificitalea manganoxidans]ATI42010.1 hypothetical protein CBW24_08330 [Pacificitalea manganoxidans]MDR6309504.1 GNAT superfamily N-acetyltransferase [Pacificitalea manganoxidans]OWU68566.1 hypothetical protein ATO2_11905 [Roseovarius sp. 22II1-1F6A]
MSAASLHLAGPEDLPKLTHLLGQAEAEAGLPERTDAERAQSLTPLVAGGPEGAAYLIGPRRAPVGFLALGFAYSLARGGLTGRIEALWIRPPVRGRGVGTEALLALGRVMTAGGLDALHIDVPVSQSRMAKLLARTGFSVRDDISRMTRRL